MRPTTPAPNSAPGLGRDLGTARVGDEPGRRLGCTVFNLRDGGLRRESPLTWGYDLMPGARAISAAPEYLDIVVLCEAKEYAFHGGAALHAMANALAEATGRPMVGWLGQFPRGEVGPAVFLDAARVGVHRWHGYGTPGTPTDKTNYCRAYHRGSGVEFALMPVHWAPQSPRARFAEAELVAWMAALDIPALVCGDTNAPASGPYEPQRDYSLLPPLKQVHKGRWPARSDGTVVADTDVMDYLIGAWDDDTDTRHPGIGLHDLAEIDALAHGNSAALAPTTHRGVERGGPVRIDRALGNAAATNRLVPGSVRIDPPPPGQPPPSDHKVLRFALDLSEFADPADPADFSGLSEFSDRLGTVVEVV